MLRIPKWLLVFSFVLVYLGTGSAQAQINPQFGIEIASEATKDVLRLHVSTEGKRRLYAYVPVKDGGDVSTVRVMPAFKDGKLVVEFYEITGDFLTAKTCEQKLLLPIRLAATEEILMQLKETSLVSADSGWSLKLTIIDGSNLIPPNIKTANNFEPEAGCTCAVCSGLSCCPNPGHCFSSCGSCGMVCCEVIVVKPS